MIHIPKHDIGQDVYEDIFHFAFSNFDIRYNEGEITIDDHPNSISYGDSYTEEDAIRDYIISQHFKDFAKSRHYIFYK